MSNVSLLCIRGIVKILIVCLTCLGVEGKKGKEGVYVFPFGLFQRVPFTMDPTVFLSEMYQFDYKFYEK